MPAFFAASRIVRPLEAVTSWLSIVSRIIFIAHIFSLNHSSVAPENTHSLVLYDPCAGKTGHRPATTGRARRDDRSRPNPADKNHALRYAMIDISEKVYYQLDANLSMIKNPCLKSIFTCFFISTGRVLFQEPKALHANHGNDSQRCAIITDTK